MAKIYWRRALKTGAEPEEVDRRIRIREEQKQKQNQDARTHEK